jgi:NTP pyrophosphatase (non-canonical NTP hydrolase)
MIDFNKYQEFTASMAVYNEDVELKVGEDTIQLSWAYPAFALSEEAGEVAGKIAKFIRKSKSFENIPTAMQELTDFVGKELGDTLFQLSEVARQFGFTLEQIAKMNVEKLTDRKDRGVIVGEGDTR